jgi:putative transposase
MAKFAGSHRFVFNKGLAEQKEKYKQNKKKLKSVELTKHLVEWKKKKRNNLA